MCRINVKKRHTADSDLLIWVCSTGSHSQTMAAYLIPSSMCSPLIFQGCTRVFGTNLISCRSQFALYAFFQPSKVGGKSGDYQKYLSECLLQVPTRLAGAYAAETLPPIIMVQWTMDDGCISNRIFTFSNFSYFPGRKGSDEQLSKRWPFSLLNNEQRWATGWGLGTFQIRYTHSELGISFFFHLHSGNLT